MYCVQFCIVDTIGSPSFPLVYIFLLSKLIEMFEPSNTLGLQDGGSLHICCYSEYGEPSVSGISIQSFKLGHFHLGILSQIHFSIYFTH